MRYGRHSPIGGRIKQAREVVRDEVGRVLDVLKGRMEETAAHEELIRLDSYASKVRQEVRHFVNGHLPGWRPNNELGNHGVEIDRDW